MRDQKLMREEPMDVIDLVARVARFASYVRGAAGSTNNRHMMEYAESIENELQRFVRDQKIRVDRVPATKEEQS